MSWYLLDTNILSEPLKPQPKRRVMERWHEHTAEIAIASVTWHRARLTRAGQPPAFTDGRIAAVAYANNLILMTNNLADLAVFQEIQT
jgi:tRNA(fMet)-specific endonuclease VapC